jgi:hypothetical protein
MKLEIHIITENRDALQYILEKVLEVTKTEKTATVTIVRDF